MLGDPRPNLDLGLQYRAGVNKPNGPEDAGKIATVDSAGVNFEYRDLSQVMGASLGTAGLVSAINDAGTAHEWQSPATVARRAYDERVLVPVPADVGEGWVTLWSETRVTLAPIDGDARDIRHHIVVAGDDATDIASMVWQYQRTDDGVLGDVIVNKDAEELAPDGTTGVEWDLALPVADATLTTRVIRVADDILVQAQAHATIDRVVTIRTYYGPIVNGPYEIGVSI